MCGPYPSCPGRPQNPASLLIHLRSSRTQLAPITSASSRSAHGTVILAQFFISSGKKEMTEGEVLHFFRPLMNNFSAKLFIPAPVAEHISKAKSRDKVTLVNHKCKMWHVDLRIEKKDMHFGGESWQDFVQDNELEIGHLLFFKYKGNMVFSFRIYDLTSCERMPRKKKIAKEVIDMEESTQSTAEKAVGCSRKRRCQEAQNTSNTKHAAPSNKKKRGKDDLNTSEANAYFEATLTANRLKRRDLYVPAPFRDCSGLSTKHTGFSIRDPEGHTWLLGIRYYRDDSFHMTNGWSVLSREHQLKAGDKLRFELVSVKGEDN